MLLLAEIKVKIFNEYVQILPCKLQNRSPLHKQKIMACGVQLHLHRTPIVTRVWIESLTQFRTGVLVV